MCLRTLRFFAAALPAVGLITLTCTRAAASGGCVDVGCIVQPFVYMIALPVAAGATVLVGADAYWTSRDLSASFSGQRPEKDAGAKQTGWTVGSAAIGTTLGAVLVTSGDKADRETGLGVLAFSTWPVALTAHGMYTSSDNHNAWPAAVAPVLAMDLAVAGTATLRLARSEPIARWRAVLTAAAMTPQIAFGAGVALHAQGSDRSKALALTAVPSAVLLQSAAVALIPRKTRDSTKDTSNTGRANWRTRAGWIASRCRVAPVVNGSSEGGTGIQIAGRF